MNKNLFIAATRQNDGKTMVSLGLFNALNEKLNNLAYMKPIGQQYRVIDGNKIDKDALLFKKVFRLEDHLKTMSPIAVDRGFTAKSIKKGNNQELILKLKNAQNELLKNHEYHLYEGTGHAGVGSVLNLSNASTAKILNSDVLLVSIGGIGKALDEIMLNKALFDKEKVQLKGVIINKVREDKYDHIKENIDIFCQRNKIKVYGYIPFIEALIRPTIAGIFEFLNEEIISGENFLLNQVNQIRIGDMSPHEMFDTLTHNTLLIVPSNREGLVMTALLDNIVNKAEKNKLSGVIFTGNRPPHKNIINLMQQCNMPALISKDTSYDISKKITTHLVKIRYEEYEKIETTKRIIQEHVDIDSIINDYYK